MIDQFFQLLWPDPLQQGQVVLGRRSKFKRPNSEKTEDVVHAHAHLQLANRGTIPKKIQAFDKPEGVFYGDVYFAVGLRYSSVRGISIGTKKDIVSWPGFWVDIDTRDEEVHRDAKYPWLEALDPVLSDALPPASAVVFTGHGLHVYWLFEQPFLAGEGSSGHQAFEKAFRAHRAPLEAAFKKKAWLLDPANVAQVLRPPGTHNYKIASNPKKVILLDTGPRYPLQILAQGLASASPAASRVSVSGGLTTHPAGESPNGTSDAAPVLDPAWKDKLRTALSEIKKDSLAPYIELLLCGEPLAEHGERNSVSNKLVNTVNTLALRFNSAADGQELYDEFFKLSVEKMIDAGSSLTEAKVVSMIERGRETAVEAEREKKVRKDRELEALRRIALRRGKHPSSPATLAPTAAGVATRPIATAEEPLPPLTPEGKAKLLRQTIIYRDNAHWVMRNGVYQEPIGENNLVLSLRDDAANNPLIERWTEPNDNGNTKKKERDALLESYGTLVRNSKLDLRIDESWYEEPNEEHAGIFHEKVPFITKNIPAVFDAQVDHWLRILPSDPQDVESLLDWVATLDRLDRQTSCLVFTGPTGTGKTLFARAAATRWAEVPTDMAQIVSSSSFNGALLTCPLVVADEKIPKGITGAELRDHIGKEGRIVTRKKLPTAELKGSLRFIINSNDPTVLAATDNEGPDALNASIARFFHIHTSQAAADYLNSLGGREGTADWIDGHRIIRHFMWLKANRDVVSDGRFLVAGRRTEAHDAIITHSGITPLVLEWIIRFMTKPALRPGIQDSVLIGDGKILINSEGMSDQWTDYFEQMKPISGNRLGKVLATISSQVEYPDYKTRKRYWAVYPDLVLNWATQNRIGNPEQLRAAISGPIQIKAGKILNLAGGAA